QRGRIGGQGLRADGVGQVGLVRREEAIEGRLLRERGVIIQRGGCLPELLRDARLPVAPFVVLHLVRRQGLYGGGGGFPVTLRHGGTHAPLARGVGLRRRRQSRQLRDGVGAEIDGVVQRERREHAVALVLIELELLRECLPIGLGLRA